VPNEQLSDRARDELFSHINRCGVLKASAEDQRQWMDETIEYIGERYPDLTDAELKALNGIGLRFCKPTIRRQGADEVLTPEAADEVLTPEAADEVLTPEGDANAA
jgi:hypothetical protein